MVQINLIFSLEQICEYLIKLGYSIKQIDSEEFDETSYSVLIAYKEHYPTILDRNSLISRCSVQVIFQNILSQKLLEL